jgi:hypothetical protein
MVAGIRTNDGAIAVDQSIACKEFCAETTRAKSAKTIVVRGLKPFAPQLRAPVTKHSPSVHGLFMYEPDS